MYKKACAVIKQVYISMHIYKYTLHFVHVLDLCKPNTKMYVFNVTSVYSQSFSIKQSVLDFDDTSFLRKITKRNPVRM